MKGHASLVPGKGWVRTLLQPKPLTLAETIEKSQALDRLLSAPLTLPSGGKPMSATSLVDRIRDVRRQRDERMAAIEKEHVARVEDAARRQDEALDRLDQKLKSDAEVNEAEVRALENEVNQLTNGPER